MVQGFGFSMKIRGFTAALSLYSAALQRSFGHGKRLRRRGPTSWSSRWRVLVSGGGELDESRTAAGIAATPWPAAARDRAARRSRVRARVARGGPLLFTAEP
jgi:hypothetical protein